MNIHWKLLPLIIILLMMPIATSVFASTGSGACSWHSGVNCDAGSDWDGSVICFDGWRDSTVGYRDVCDGGCAYGYTDEFKQIILDCFNNKSDHQTELEEELVYWQTLRNGVTRDWNALFVNGTIPDENKSKAIGLNSVRQAYDKRIQSIEDYIADEKTFQTQSCQGLTASMGKFYCKSPVVVTITCPENTVNLNGDCICPSDYTWNSSKTSCTKKQVLKIAPIAPPIVVSKSPETIIPQSQNRKEDQTVDTEAQQSLVTTVEDSESSSDEVEEEETQPRSRLSRIIRKIGESLHSILSVFRR